jgi:acetylglutamate kinase
MAERVISLLEAVPWLRAYHGATFVVKAGGELLDDPRWLEGLMRDVSVLRRLGVGIVFVHGGGPQLDRAAQAAGLPFARVAGRRVTTPALIELAQREWRGKLSADCVLAIYRHGETGVGLAGFDGGLVTAARRPPSMVVDDDGQRRTVDYGEVGDVLAVDPRILEVVLQTGAIPVVTPLCAGSTGSVLNVNADTVAAEIAVAVRAAKLVFATRVPGILGDLSDPRTVLTQISMSGLEELERAGTITGGMRPKVAAIRRAMVGGVPRVHIIDGRRAGALLEEVFTAEGTGTMVVQ